jgi:hypothetical protein
MDRPLRGSPWVDEIEMLLPFLTLTVVAVSIALGARRALGDDRMTRARPLVRLSGIAVLLVLLTLRTWH